MYARTQRIAGGGVVAFDSGRGDFRNSIVQNNTCATNGGGVCVCVLLYFAPAVIMAFTFNIYK